MEPDLPNGGGGASGSGFPFAVMLPHVLNTNVQRGHLPWSLGRCLGPCGGMSAGSQHQAVVDVLHIRTLVNGIPDLFYKGMGSRILWCAHQLQECGLIPSSLGGSRQPIQGSKSAKVYGPAKWEMFAALAPFSYSEVVSSRVSSKGVCTLASSEHMINQSTCFTPNKGRTHSFRPRVKVY